MRMIGLILGLMILTGPTAYAGGPKHAPSPDQPEAKKQAPAPKAPAPSANPAPKKPAPKTPAPKKPAPKPPQAKPATKGNGGKPAATKTPLKIRIRARDVYLGRYRSFRKPAVLDCQKVFNSISYYQKVKRDRLNKKSGRYWILMQKANRIFYKALRRLSRERGYDLIGARNSIVINGANPRDVTKNLLQIIPSITLD
jgi:hypothetical protein